MAKGASESSLALSKEGDVSSPFSKSYIPYLDGFRALSVLLVMFWHYHISLYLPGPFGVTTFFFISGFLITTLLLREQQAGGIGLARFWLRRLARLWPPLVLLVVVCCAVMSYQGGFPETSEIFAALFYYTNYYRLGADQTLLSDMWGPLWSLSVEEHFYLAYPLLLMAVGLNKKRQLLVIGALIIVPLLIRMFNFYILDAYMRNYVSTETRIDNIAWGCLFALMPEVSRKAIFTRLRWWVIAATCVLLASSFYIYEHEFSYVYIHTVQSFCLFVLFGVFFYSEKFKAFYGLLESRVFRYVGKISYEVYLWHMPVYFTVLSITGDSIERLIALPITFIISAAAYQLLDRPLYHLRKKLR